MKNEASKIIVGSAEWLSFSSLGIPAIKARVDSGAKTSSMHAFNIQPFKRHGTAWVSFEVHPLQDNRSVAVRCECPVIDRRLVKSSSGNSERRYVIKAPVKIGSHKWEIEVTLANRDSMGFRMLLGREAMHGRMLVDPSTSFCCGQFSEKELDNFYGQASNIKSGLKIGLLASNPDLYSNKRIMEAAEERGHEVIFLNIQPFFKKQLQRVEFIS